MIEGKISGSQPLGKTAGTARRRPGRLLPGWQLVLVTGLAFAASCGSGTSAGLDKLPPAAALPPSEVAQVTSALAGKDGALTVAVGNTIVNTYAALAADIQPGDKTIKVTGIAALNAAAGDLLLVIQMQGATLDFTDTINFGAVTNYNGAGRFEFLTVSAVNAASGTITVASCTNGIRNAYSVAGHTQLVRVPQYTTLTVALTGSLTAPSWDGTTGGIVAIQAQTAVALNGKIDVTGLGFRPGVIDQVTTTPPAGVKIFRSIVDAQGGEKGEGIGGYGADYDNVGGRYGRGAPGNGGGGGNAHNAAGGGGANAANLRSWGRGQGVMDITIMGGALAWPLDPGYIANGKKPTTDGGGGRGGYTYGAANLDATMVGPDNATWGGDYRSEVGGLGGRPLDPGVTQRLFLGGGGGAGDANNGASTPGGTGGGLVFVATPTVTGTGSITASGSAAGDTKGANNDAPGGGGGGGTVVVAAQTLSKITVTADGGSGGNQLMIGAESEGGGGGGSGGFIAVVGTNATTSVAGGKSGTTQSTSVTEFPANGGTNGSPGNDKLSAQPLVPLLAALDCSPQMADLAVTIKNNLNGGPATPGSPIQYTVTYKNLSTTTAVKAASIADTIAPGIAPQLVAWTCTSQGAAACPAASGTGSIPPSQVDFPAGSSLTYVVTVPVPANASGPFSYSAAIEAPLDIADPISANNTATDIAKLPSLDLAVTVGDNLQGKNAKPGSPVIYTVTVANIGALPVTGGRLTDTLPAGVTIASWTCVGSGNATCPAASGTGALATNMLNLPAGGSVTYTATTTAIPDNMLPALGYRLGVLPPAGQTDADLSNNQAVSVHAVDNSASMATASDLGLKLSHTPQKLFPGQNVTYTAQVNNAGPQTVTSALVVFAVPAGSTIKTPAAGTGWTCVQSGVVASCVLPTLVAGDAAPIQVVITDPAAAVPGGQPLAVGSVSAAKNTDPNSANDSATDVGSLPKADLALTIDRSPATPQAGAEATYTLVASNGGPDTAPTPSVVFTIPAGGTVTMPASGTGWVCAQTQDTVTCLGPDLAMGAAPPITIKVQLPTTPATATPPLVGEVGSAGVDDPNLANNRAVSSAANAPNTKADLGITLSRSPATSQPGQVVTYTAQVTNLGNDQVYSPTVTFQLPAGGVVVQAAQGPGWVCQQAGDTVTCERSTLAVGPAPPITVKLLTPLNPAGNPAAATGTVAASVAAVNNVDPAPANDSAVSAAATVPSTSSDLAVTVSRNPQAPNVGDPETITVQVTDNGQAPAIGVAVTVQVPPNTQIVQPAQGDGWRCVPNGQAYLCTRDRIDVGPAPPITLIVVTPGTTATGEAPQLGVSAAAASTPTDPTPADNSTEFPIGSGSDGTGGGTTGGNNGTLRLEGGGFACSMDPTSPAVPTVQLAVGALVAALLRRRRR